MTDIDTPERRRRNRRMLLAIFALFFGSMLVAGLLRFSGWRPEGTKSHGELLDPPVDLREARLELVSGGDYAWNPGERLWRLAVAPPADCEAACDDVARDLDVVWRTLGHRADRIEILWLCVRKPVATCRRHCAKTVRCGSCAPPRRYARACPG